MSDSHVTITADPRQPIGAVSPTLYGLFFEDINRACDGGLNANQLPNHSFEGAYIDRRLHNETIAMITKRRGRLKRDPLRHWIATAGEFSTHDRGGMHDKANFARLATKDGTAIVRNSGYGPISAPETPSISARAGVESVFRGWIRAERFHGDAVVRLVDGAGIVAHARIPLDAAGGWRRVEVGLQPARSSRAHFEVVLDGTGVLELDELSLICSDHWGAGDPRWSQGLLRRDLVESLAALKPTFMRFPGGCVVEGVGGDNAYDWKRTVGELHTRRADFNLWGLRVPDGDYSQSNQIGYYEYFLLCEDLGMEPMPVVPAGVSCQFRSRECVHHDHPAFDRIVQDVLDLIDWATADPAESPWAALRAEAGHPEPFTLTYLGIGNENHGRVYQENFARIRDAVTARHPGIIPVLSAGPFARGAAFDAAWEFARTQPSEVLVDEHFYKSPSWFIANTRRYDAYPRERARVFAGEYAARSVTANTTPNTFESALAEAAFLTGVERNADAIAMTSYAPVLCNVGARLWPHNLMDFSPDRVCPSANYEVQRMFGTTVGKVIVPVTADLPDGVFASSTADATTQFVKLVNTTDAPLSVELRMPTAQAGSAVLETLQADLADRNTLDFDGERVMRVRARPSEARVDDECLVVELAPRSVVSLTVPRAFARPIE